MPRLSDTFLLKDRAKSATAWMPIFGVRFKIACAMNDGYQDAIKDQLRKVNKNGVKKEQEKYFAKAVADHLLLDWEDLEGDDGKPLDCTDENKMMVLTKYVEIGVRIVEFANNTHNFVGANSGGEEVPDSFDGDDTEVGAELKN